MANANANRTYIYTKQCKLCGHTDAYASLSHRLTTLGKDVYVKQTSLFAGWQAEADEIGLEMPFVLDYDTMQSETVENLDKMNEEELRDWLGL